MNDVTKAAKASFASVKAAARAYAQAATKAAGAMKALWVYAITERDVPEFGDFVGLNEPTAKAYASALNTMRALTENAKPADREAIAAELCAENPRDFGTAVGLLRDALAGKTGSTATDVLEGKGETRKLKDDVAPLKPGAIAAIAQRRKEAKVAAAEPVPAGVAESGAGKGNATPPPEAVAAPKARFNLAVAALSSAIAEATKQKKWLNKPSNEELKMLADILSGIEADMKP